MAQSQFIDDISLLDEIVGGAPVIVHSDAGYLASRYSELLLDLDRSGLADYILSSLVEYLS